MSRKNCIGICGICVCVLLLVVAQHRPTLIQEPPQFTTESAANSSVTIAEIIDSQRSRIAFEMENFEYPSGRFQVDVNAERLSDLTMETNGQPVRSVIITTWRSGSTFLGDILNAMPANFYHYEPLLNWGIRRIRGRSDSDKAALRNLKSLLKCDFSKMSDYLLFGQEHTYLFEHNIRLWNQCTIYPLYCWQPKFLTPYCKLFPLQSMKTVRMSLNVAENLLEDSTLNVRLLLLVRDPRGTMQSRKHRDWCPGNSDCDLPSHLCRDLIDDYESSRILLKKYPYRFRTLRYEDLSLNPYEVTQDVLQFFGLPFDPAVEEFLDTHTKLNIGGVSSTFRDSKTAPFHWKEDLSWEEIKEIEEHCTKAMEVWGYRQAHNNTELIQKSFDPLVLPAPFS